jgi:NADH:ubiquinone oxidoreductase subunit 6 (subunit J)
MASLVMFCILAVVILGSAVLCVTTKRIMRSVTFLLFVLLGVAGLYFLLDYTYLGAAQISVYAGAMVMMYVFAVQLVSKRTLQGLVERVKGCRALYGALLCVVGLVTVVGIQLKNGFLNLAVEGTEVPMETIGKALLGSEKYQYVLPFEFISVFLLACIVGAIVVARKEKEKK